MNTGHFERAVSDVQISRSTFEETKRHLTTMNAGFLVPIASFDVLPGSTWSVDISSFVRMSTPIHPPMDDAWLDVMCFFVPMRQTWSKTKEFFGEPNADPFEPTPELLEPVLIRGTDSEVLEGTVPPGSIDRRSLAAYYGIPIGTRPGYFNAKYFRGYGLIWNRWFRAQQLQTAIDVPVDSIDRHYARSTSPDPIPDVQADPDYYINCAKDAGCLAPVCKFHDYFTSALTQPQLGDPAAIPLNGVAPVYAVEDLENVYARYGNTIIENGNRNAPVKVGSYDAGDDSYGVLGVSGGNLSLGTDQSLEGAEYTVFLNNLVADLGYNEELSKSLGRAYSTINDLRYAFATQKFLENDNVFGTRYRELLYSHFGITASNIELQDPEMLGGKRVHINTSQVVQTSSTDDVSPQGNVAAYSLTSDKDFLFRKSFTEHGVIHILACIRTNHSYQQGLEKRFSKRSKFEHYFPEFANIGEQPVLRKEIYISQSSSNDPGESEADLDKPFGFQEAWAEYRSLGSNRISGQFASQLSDSLDSWHYGDYYLDEPHLSAGWIAETYKNIDRTLAVTSELADQFLCDFAFKIRHTEPMPIYSIPGLTPHF